MSLSFVVYELNGNIIYFLCIYSYINIHINLHINVHIGAFKRGAMFLSGINYTADNCGEYESLAKLPAEKTLNVSGCFEIDGLYVNLIYSF